MKRCTRGGVGIRFTRDDKNIHTSIQYSEEKYIWGGNKEGKHGLE